MDCSGQVACPTEGCGAPLATHRHGDTSIEDLYMFVDHNNIRIEAQKVGARKLKLLTEEDPSVRLAITKLVELMASGREVVRGTLYGSKPPFSAENDWRKLNVNGRWSLFMTKNPQKQMEEKLVADVTELVSDVNIKKGTVIIPSGDADVIPAIVAGLRKGWRFEVWAWEASTSGSLRAIESANPGKVKVCGLDRHFQDVTDVKVWFKREKFEQHLKEQTAVLADAGCVTPTPSWRNGLCAELGWPFEVCWTDQKECSYLMLVMGSVAAQNGQGNAKQHFQATFQRLREIFGNQVMTYLEFQKRAFAGVGSREDFEKPEEELVLLERMLRDLGPDPVAGKRASSRMRRAAGSSGYASLGSTPASIPSARSSASLFFQPITGINPREWVGRQLIQMPTPVLCRRGVRCSFRLQCRYQHTEAEQEFFRNPRKCILCRYGIQCKKEGCPYAHSKRETFCRRCSMWGHPETTCPAR